MRRHEDDEQPGAPDLASRAAGSRPHGIDGPDAGRWFSVEEDPELAELRILPQLSLELRGRRPATMFLQVATLPEPSKSPWL